MTHRFLRGRNLALVLATALLSLGATAGTASAATTTFTNSGKIDILDDQHANPYPSTLNVNVPGLAGNLQKVTATLHGYVHTCPTDVAILLVGPSGANSTLMGYVGGCPGAPDSTGVIDITFDQASTRLLNDTDVVTSGTYRPSENGTTTLSPPAPTGPYPLNLGAFNNLSPNGTWSLFIEDQAGVDVGQVQGGWSLNVTAPVNTVSAGKPKLNKNNGTATLPVTVGDAGQLTLSGKGVKTASATESKAVAGPGTVKLKVKPKGKTASTLNSTGKATVKAKITFTPTGGTSNTVKKKIKLKKTLG